MNVRDVQKLQLPTKTSQSSPNGVDDRRIKARERDSRGYEHFKRTCLSHIISTFRHEKAVRALGAAFANSRPKTCSNKHFQRSVGAV